MKGLIKKDLLFLKGYLKTLLFILIGLVFFGITNKQMNVAAFLPFFAVMIGIASFSYDDYNKWDTYAITLPVSKKQIVASKYLFTIFLTAISTIIGLACSFLLLKYHGDAFNMDEYLLQVFGGVCGILLVLAIIYPFLYKFGTEKGRMIFFIVIFGGSAAIAGLSMLLNKSMISWVPSAILDNLLVILPYFFAIVTLLLLWLSYFISYHIYERKEF